MLDVLGVIGFIILVLAMIVGIHVDKLRLPALILLVVIQIIGLCLLAIGLLH